MLRLNVRQCLIALSVALPLVGCSEQKLAACVASTEPTILLRQLNLTGPEKDGFEKCRANPAIKHTCQVIYPGADNLLTDCMERNGYPSRAGSLIALSLECW
jgi:hypothetical protein